MTAEDRLVKKTAICSTLFALGVSIILFQLPNQGIVETIVEQTIQDSEESSEGTINYYDEEAGESTNTGVTSYLKIPLPAEVMEEDITLENSYINQAITISINNIDKDFFADNPLVGSSDHISDIVYSTTDNVAQIELLLDSVYEYSTEYIDNSLNISFIEPRSQYDKIVVIDPGHGGKDNGTEHFNTLEKEVNLEIVLKLKELLDASDIKAYFTRLDDTKPDNATRVEFANNLKADFFISVHNNGDKTASSSNGTEVLYNDNEENVTFGSEALAQICQEELVKELGSRDRGIVSGSDIKIIRLAEVPVALVEVGFITNKTEAANLSSESYQEKAAQAIYNSIVRAYEERDSISTDVSGTQENEDE